MADRYPDGVWNPVPRSCFTATRTKKLAICNHRPVGWISYMRNPHPEAVRRRISAHLTLDMDGGVQQHVDFDMIAHTQGIKRSQYDFARKNWPLFQDRNPNADCIGIESEDGGRAFSAERPMPNAEMDALIDVHKWLLAHQIGAAPVLNRTVISHDILTTNRHQDAGDWVMNTLMDALVPAGSFELSPASLLFDPIPGPPIRRPSAQTVRRLKKLIRSGKKRCTFDDAVTVGWVTGEEAGPWSRLVWYGLRRNKRSPLAPWRDGVHLYEAICGTIMAESNGDPKAHNHNENGWLPGGETGPSDDWGLVQGNSAAWPNITKEQWLRPMFAINFICKHFPENPIWWHGYRVWLARR